MKKETKKFLLPASCFLLLFFSCAHVDSGRKQPLDTFHEETEKETGAADSYFRFLQSDAQALAGNYEKARENLNIVLKANPEVGFLYYELALDESDQKHFDAAIENCEKALKLSPKLVQARLLLARLYAMQEKHAEAANIIEDTIREFPQETEAYTLLAHEYIALKRYNEAVGVMQRLLIVEPESSQAYFYLGLINGSYLKRYGKAMEAYQKILETEADNIQIHAAIAQLLLDQKQKKKALKKLVEMESIDPEDISIQLKLALIYFDIKDYANAAERFERLLASNPDSDKIRYYLGIVYVSAGREDDAIKNFVQIPPKSSFYKDAVLQTVLYYYTRKDVARSTETLEKAIHERPDEPEYHRFLAAIFEESHEYDKMMGVLKKGVATLPGDEKIVFALGMAYDRLKQKDKAILTMKRVIELNPKNSSALNYVGYSYAENGENLGEAEDMLQTAISLKPNDGFILDSLGWLYFKKGDLTKAYELLRRAAQLSPKEATVFEHLGDLMGLRGDVKKSLEMYQKALRLAKERKEPDEEEIKRLDQKVCEAGGC